MKWKDFLYFQKNDKIAIVLLLVLIVFCGAIYLLSDSLFKSAETIESRQALIEFENFQKGLEKKTTKEVVAKKEKSNKTITPVFSKLKEGETIDLNTANVATAKRIPGIGDEFALRIITYKNSLGGFVSANQLLEIRGVTPNKYNKIISFIRISGSIRPLKINKLTKEQLSLHPYISNQQAINIVLARESNKIKSIEALSEIEGFTPRDIDKLSQYLSFE